MRLDREEIRDLATYLARRFPEPGTRHRLAMRAAVSFAEDEDPQGAWEALLIAAQDRRRMAELAPSIAAEDHEDARLQEICRLLMPPPARRWPLGVGAAAAGVLAALVVWAWPADPLEAEPALAQPILEAAADAVVTAAALPVAAPAAAEPAPAPEPEPEPEPRPAPEPVPAPAAVLASTAEMPPEKPAPKRAPGARSGCEAAEGELIGYWYAGEQDPGQVGDVVTVPAAVNVRGEYPSASNRFRVRGAVRCHLPTGAQVRLSAEPLHIPGDRYWVPLRGGDVQ